MYQVKKPGFCKVVLSNFKSQITGKYAYRNVATSFLSIEDMPHPREMPLFGTKLSLLAAGSGSKLHEYVDSRHKQLGPIFYEKLEGNTKLVFISDPGLIKTLFLKLDGKYPAHILPEPWLLYEKLYGSKRGLFFMNGEDWLLNRKIMNKQVLIEDSQKWLEYPVVTTINEFIEGWRRKADMGDFVADLESDLYRLSTNVIINILLGTECVKRDVYYDELVTIFSESVKKIFITTTKLYGLPVSWYQRLNLKPWRDFKESVDSAVFLAHKIVREILSQKKSTNGLVHKLSEENMAPDVITRIVSDFIIAAGDTTAYTTLWTLFLISNHDSVKDKIREDGINYVKYVVKESMRLYPVAPFLTRILPKECVLGQYKLHEGSPIIASIYTSGRNENNFTQADKFAPCRWDRNDPRKIDFVNHVPSATIPFALGARSCIGKKIAMLQLTEIIYQIVNNFEFTCENNKKVDAITSQVLIPDKDIILKFSLRQNQPNRQLEMS